MSSKKISPADGLKEVQALRTELPGAARCTEVFP
jgi:hypothetical protein